MPSTDIILIFTVPLYHFIIAYLIYGWADGIRYMISCSVLHEYLHARAAFHFDREEEAFIQYTKPRALKRWLHKKVVTKDVRIYHGITDSGNGFNAMTTFKKNLADLSDRQISIVAAVGVVEVLAGLLLVAAVPTILIDLLFAHYRILCSGWLMITEIALFSLIRQWKKGKKEKTSDIYFVIHPDIYRITPTNTLDELLKKYNIPRREKN